MQFLYRYHVDGISLNNEARIESIDPYVEPFTEGEIEVSNIIMEGTTPLRVEKFIERVAADYDDIQFQNNFRLTRPAYLFLLGKLSRFTAEDDFIMSGRPQIQLEQQLLSVIWLLANQESFR